MSQLSAGPHNKRFDHYVVVISTLYVLLGRVEPNERRTTG